MEKKKSFITLSFKVYFPYAIEILEAQTQAPATSHLYLLSITLWFHVFNT